MPTAPDPVALSTSRHTAPDWTADFKSCSARVMVSAALLPAYTGENARLNVAMTETMKTSRNRIISGSMGQITTAA